MFKKALILGGAGFIGSHLADELLAHGYHVRVLDNLDPQVHGEDARRPSYLNKQVELIIGDLRDAKQLQRALAGIDVVCHLAAAVGVGQSMYEISRYSSVNAMGTALLLEALIKRPVERLLVASSMSIYGEGLYRDRKGHQISPPQREFAQLRAGHWDLTDESGRPLTPIATPETKTPDPTSVYALLKYNQERMCLCVGDAYRIPTVALRFFNTFGPRQALSNPYTGVLAIFGARLINGRPPIIYEDGLQRRDFVNVRDVARACRLALESNDAIGGVFNIGSGESCTILTLAERMAAVLGKPRLRPQTTGKCRIGDIRHCFADIDNARKILNYEPRIPLEKGLDEFAQWLDRQVATDRIPQASAELAARGLSV
jgi:dTDP-L-rhamnose 4-epimerase